MASTVALKGRPLATLLKQLLADAPSAATGRPVATPAASGRARRYDVVDESGTDNGEEYDATDDSECDPKTQ
uniref:Uncharacterized protein n=1 Tax=Oryza glumipatula TaxID=40148 RepID=A0A0E0ALD8_9ORYZ